MKKIAQFMRAAAGNSTTGTTGSTGGGLKGLVKRAAVAQKQAVSPTTKSTVTPAQPKRGVLPTQASSTARAATTKSKSNSMIAQEFGKRKRMMK